MSDIRRAIGLWGAIGFIVFLFFLLASQCELPSCGIPPGGPRL